MSSAAGDDNTTTKSNASKSRFPPSRPWTASGSRSPFSNTEEPSNNSNSTPQFQTAEQTQKQRRKKSTVFERSLIGGVSGVGGSSRRQRKAAERHHAPSLNAADDDQSSLKEDDEDDEEEKEEAKGRSKKSSKRLSSSANYRKYSVSLRREFSEKKLHQKNQKMEEEKEKEKNNIPLAEKPTTATEEQPKPSINGSATTTATKHENNNEQQISAIKPSTKFVNVAKSFKNLSSIRFRKSRVADSSGINAASQNQTEFLKKFGLTNFMIQADDREEYKRNKLKYIFNKLVFDSNARYFYYWLTIVSMAYVYNLIVPIARAVFTDISAGSLWLPWMGLDLFFDSIYFLDMFIRSRTGFLEQGLLVRDVKRTTKGYVKSIQFRLDILSFFPADYIMMLIFRKPLPIFRLNRLLRRDRVQKFMEQTETRSSMPNVFRVSAVVWYICVIIHWNACFYFLISEYVGLGSDGWVYGSKNIQAMPPGSAVADTLARRYVYSFYWSTLILTTIGEVPWPQQNIEFVFVTLDLMCGVLIFATIVGNVGTMISNMSAARADFQTKMDSIKQFMELRRVSKALEVRVIKWFDYLWDNKQGLNDQQVLHVLPDKLQAEIAMHVHFETLRKVRIFQDCEAGLLAELVLKLKLQVFSPGDFICRKGDIGREMYIVKRGKLQVVADDGITVYATLMEGAVFGELSILNIAGSKNGNRRTANVRSVGYTDLFVLNKTDLWTALREYPEARKMLIQKGREILRKDNLLDENAPEENKTAEEIADELQTNVRLLQQKIARLIAERINTDEKLKSRIEYMEQKLAKYEAPSDESEDESDNEENADDGDGKIVEKIIVPSPNKKDV